jgi:hypothetical protein
MKNLKTNIQRLKNLIKKKIFNKKINVVCETKTDANTELFNEYTDYYKTAIRWGNFATT